MKLLHRIFRKPKIYKEVDIFLMRYQSPTISLGYNKATESKKIKLRDLIIDKQDNLCKIDDAGMISYSPIFIDKVLDWELVANYGYTSEFFNKSGEYTYFKTIEELLQSWLPHILHGSSSGFYPHPLFCHINDPISVLKDTEIPFIREFLENRCCPIFLDNNFNILKSQTNHLVSYRMYGGSSYLPPISYGAFYENAEGKIIHANCEQLLIRDNIKARAFKPLSEKHRPKGCVKIYDNIYYKDDFVQFRNYDQFNRTFKSFVRDRKISAIFAVPEV